MSREHMLAQLKTSLLGPPESQPGMQGQATCKAPAFLYLLGSGAWAESTCSSTGQKTGPNAWSTPS